MSSSSDEVRIIDAPAGSGSSRQRSTSRPIGSATKPGRARAASKINTDVSSDSDEPVFVGSSVGAKLADKFTFKQAARPPPSRSRSRSTLDDDRPSATSAEAGPSRLAGRVETKEEKKPIRKRVTKTDSKPGLGLNEVLLPELNLEPLPVPSWLGPAKILKELPVCPLCRKQLKASESGPARWRHISTCLPPLHRPPNPPPDLQRVISAALEAVKAPLGPASLIDYHMSAHGDSAAPSSTSAALIPSFLTGNTAVPPRTAKKAGKTKAPAALVGLRIATVEPAYERVDWDTQIDERLGEFIGHPSPGSTKSADLLSSPIFTSTQPLGESTLASQYIHPDRIDSPSPQTPSSPAAMDSREAGVEDELSDDADAVMPPSSQAGRDSLSPPPFGEAREPMGASPGTSDRSDREEQKDTDQNGFESKREKAAAFGEKGADGVDGKTKTRRRTKSPVRPRTPAREVPSSPESGDGISPDTTITSNLTITPRNLYTRRPRTSNTPTFAPPESPSNGDGDDMYAYHVDGEVAEWGDDAMLSWNGAEGEYSGDEDAVSHMSLDSGITDDDLETWGRDAIIDFTFESEPSSPEMSVEYDGVGAEEEILETVESSPEAAVEELADEAVEGEEITEQLLARGMPDYDSWDVSKLQKLTEKYGYRPMTKHATLVKIAVDCWKAIHPRVDTPPLKPKAKKRAARVRPAVDSQDSITSAEVPLATTTSKGKTKRKGKAKGKAVVDEPDPTPAVELEQQFFNLIYDDRELYTRILRYEPISFDEFISKALANGITHRSYKVRLAKFLDMQGITYYTQDPTGQRRRR